MNPFVKTNFDVVHTEDVLKRPMTPGKWVGRPSYLEITRLHMTCGGGIGGSTWFEYISRINLMDLAKDESNYLVTQRWNGSAVFINKAYVVSAEQFTIAYADYESLNPNYPAGTYTYYYLTEDGHKFTLSNA